MKEPDRAPSSFKLPAATGLVLLRHSGLELVRPLHLDLFFKSLGVPYRAFEAEGPEAVAEAIRQIEGLEREPIPYAETRPRKDLSGFAYTAAGLGIALLVLAKLAEADLRRAPAPPAAAAVEALRRLAA